MFRNQNADFESLGRLFAKLFFANRGAAVVYDLLPIALDLENFSKKFHVSSRLTIKGNLLQRGLVVHPDHFLCHFC